VVYKVTPDTKLHRISTAR